MRSAFKGPAGPLPVVLAAVCFAVAALLPAFGCGPDPNVEAQQQEIAALRRQAALNNQEQATQPTYVPLSDSSTAPEAPSATTPPGATPSTAPTTGGSSTSANTPSSTTPGSARPTDPAASKAGLATPPGSKASSTKLSSQDPLTGQEFYLPVYPNSQPYQEPGAPDTSLQSDKGINLVLIETPDKPEQVIDFYYEKLSHDASDPKKPDVKITQHPSRVERTQDGKKVVTLTEVQDGGARMRTVEVRSEKGKTVIELMNIFLGKDRDSQHIPASVAPPPSH